MRVELRSEPVLRESVADSASGFVGRVTVMSLGVIQPRNEKLSHG
jgi:hypothetical protein